MNVDILGLDAFLAIARHGRFTAAARALHISQTALTRRLQQLEAMLGVQLVERTTRSVALTPLGESFLPQARRLVGELRAALVEIRETGRAARGDVAIACVPTVGIQYLPRVIQEYSERHPDNRIQIYDHALARRKRLAWRKLAGHPLVFVGSESGNRPLLDAALADAEAPLHVHYEVQRSSTAVGLAAAGVAAAIVPQLAIQRGAYPNLRVVPLVDPVVSRSLVLVTRAGAQLSPAAQALVDLLLQR